ncbi:MAG: HesA/MoeB/ThiF family protein [Bacteroidales bacterium]
MTPLHDFLRASAQGDLLPWAAQLEASARFGTGLAEIEGEALDLGLLPARYQRNRQTISVAQQARLFSSRVVVVGCGGLGGYVVEQLARLGVGTIVAIDPDVFEEHNLNRQVLSTVAALGRAKVEVAAERIAQVNPAVTLVARREAFARDRAALLHGADVVVDALDSIPTRLELSEVCASLGLPLVHAAIAGWYGQVVTEYPGAPMLERLYRTTAAKGAEQTLGNPAFTPAVMASIQTAEVCKILLNLGRPLRGRVISVDLQEMGFDEITLED